MAINGKRAPVFDEPVREGDLPPSPRVPAILKLPGARNDPESFLRSLSDQPSDAASFRLGRRHAVFLNEPSLIHEVLVHQAEKFTKGFIRGATQKLLGESIFSSEGAPHYRQRRAILPMLRHERLDPFVRLMHESALAVAARWPDDGTVDAYVEMDALSLHVCLINLFGETTANDEKVVREALPVVQDAYERATSPLRFALDRLPLPATRRMNRQVAELHGWVEARIEANSRDAEASADMLTQLLAHRYRDGGPDRMSRADVRDELVDLIVGSHCVVSMSLTYTLLLLARAPEVQAGIREEVAGVLGARAPTLADLRGLSYTHRAVREAVRMFPPAWGFLRMARQDVQVGPYLVPEGSYIMLSPAVTQRDARYFPDPDRYDPDRWVAPAVHAQNKEAFFAFGAGPRACVGEPMAMAELTTMVAAIVPRVELGAVLPGEPRRKLRFVNAPDEPVPVRVRRIRADARDS